MISGSTRAKTKDMRHRSHTLSAWSSRGQGLSFGWSDYKITGMPIFEFHCEQCDRDSEILIRSKDWQGTKCPNCGSKKLSKKLSVFASRTAGAADAPACTGVPSSCGMCGTGRPHSH
jgi:putative FmdB family regulatory protein